MIKRNKYKFRKAVFIVAYKIDEKNNKIEYLLLKRKLHWNGWEFPKGGVDKNESLRHAVARETIEETGNKAVRIIKFNMAGRYKYAKIFQDRPNIIGQTYSLFAVEIKPKNSKKIKIDKKEHSAFLWLDFTKALNKVTYQNQKKSLKIVNTYLLNNKLK
jgi:8-oxo-dGTP pyrophosphatase MutT (NUDIX family)